MTYTLNELGWREFFDQQLNETDTGLIRARVNRQDINRYHLLAESGVLLGILPGKSRQTFSKAELPSVGDWVLCQPADEGDPSQVVIQRTLPRFSKFSRKEAGDRQDEQIVAANVDHVFIVTGLDDNFNANRIERYLLLAWTSGASPVIILSKADLCEDLDEYLEILEPIAMGTPIHVVSARESQGLEALAGYITPGKTVALLGSSGVGKSTMINALLGYDHFKTGEVREGDSKGRHTTTFRELIIMEGGGLLIDTPGMREIQLWTDDATVVVGFDDVAAFARQCRFSDCAHQSEPGCAIRAAIASGDLNADRMESYLKFQRELAHFAEKQDASLRAVKKVERKKFARSIRNRPTKRDK